MSRTCACDPDPSWTCPVCRELLTDARAALEEAREMIEDLETPAALEYGRGVGVLIARLDRAIGREGK